MQVTEIRHPLIQHKLSLMRNIHTPTETFRRLLREISQFMTFEITKDLEIEFCEIETPLQLYSAPFLKGKKLSIIQF